MTAIDSTMSGWAATRARIAAIQTQLGMTPTVSPTSSTTATDSASASASSLDLSSLSGGDFQSMLDQITNAAATSATTSTTTSGPTGQDVVDAAKQYLGVPYVYGGSDPKTGLDCSGLVQQAYKDVGIDLPRVTYDQVKVGTPVDRADLQPGDLVFSVGDKGNRVNGHVGIYVGDGKYIVAPHTGDVVKIKDLPTNITAIRRILPSAGANANVSPSTTATSAATSQALSSALTAALSRSASTSSLSSLLTSSAAGGLA